MPDTEDKPTQSFDPRPPGQRRRAGERSDSTRQRRSRSGKKTEPTSRRDSVFGRISGRSELERAKVKRYEPYTFDSNNTQLRWVVIALVFWSIVALWLAWEDRVTASVLSDLREQGYTTTPPTVL